ncbi:PadR family transcriptional regulator [Picrophilus oshimae]|uniref:Transcriptional regulator, PadR family n=1 Tax=Picrophilus torridus (strain ATCC 700027 / DSM 9790 / JCM 10055 / NBRC 100828 / KAW 2/3) TaxID=1122961 RepID=A0A8G2L7G2_PICTO|nr:PadR family transcriptional regulator [Picrophilus oshimae]SMD30955.1 transcriptional regulator, PadR family [Picrophilus oshimae DSM 9789]
MKKELILKGTINLLILTELYKNSMHGYAIEKLICSKINIDMPHGAIYMLLHNLERRGFIKGKISSNGRHVKEYEITDSGIKFLKDHEKPLEKVSTVINYLIEEIKNIN